MPFDGSAPAISCVWKVVGDYYPLTEPDSHLEWFAIWKKASRVEPVISNFIDMLDAELESDQGPQ